MQQHLYTTRAWLDMVDTMLTWVQEFGLAKYDEDMGYKSWIATYKGIKVLPELCNQIA